MQPLLQWKDSVTYCDCVFVALSIQHAFALESYCRLWPVRLCNIFGKKLLNMKCVF